MSKPSLRVHGLAAVALSMNACLAATGEAGPSNDDSSVVTAALYTAPYPGYGVLDLDDFEDELNELTADHADSDVGTECRPAIPTLPQGTLTEVSASTASAVTSAASAGSRRITLTADVIGVTTIVGDDVELDLNGFTLDQLNLGSPASGMTPADAPHRLHILGPGQIGVIFRASSAVQATDILIDGVQIGPDFMSTPQSRVAVDFSGNGSVARFGLVNSMIKGFSGQGNAGAGMILSGTDIVVANTNIGAGLNLDANPMIPSFNDDWGIRVTSTDLNNPTARVVIADSFIRAKHKPAVRQSGAVQCEVLFSTALKRATDRRMTLMNVYSASIDATISQGSVTDRLLRVHTRWVAARQPSTVSNWGPSTVNGNKDYLYLLGDTDIRATSSSVFGPTILSTKQSLAELDEETWDMDFITGAANTFTYADPIDSLVPAWPAVYSPAVGFIGNNPYNL